MSVIFHTEQLQQARVPLFALTPAELNDWRTEHPDADKWLVSIGYKDKGLALIPSDSDTSSLMAVWVSENYQDAFVCGDIATQLPAHNFYIATERSDDELFNIAFGWGAGSYRFTRYKNNDQPLASLYLDNADVVARVNQLLTATELVRDLINTPAEDMMPQHLSAVMAKLADDFSADFNEIEGDDLLQLGYPMIHAVGRASDHSPRLLDLRWGPEGAPRITLVGKGVCFDSGGLNIKTGNFMRQMKKDMGGSAQVLGVARLIMSSGLNVRLRVLVPAVENAIAGNAFRPGDILPTRKGLTVEIDNTDAEGRLVLCDALAEAVSEQPELVIDFATLTGACRVALGTELPGFFTNQPDVAQGLIEAGQQVSDPVWQLPLHQPYADMLKSDIADLVNGAASPFGGAITAALYLQAFVDETPWVHFDIMAWNNRKLPGRPVGGEAMGMRAVYEFLQRRYGN